MAQRIVIASQKGGVGKTTVALHLALALAERGRSVLLADLDPQGGIGLSLAKGDAELPGLADYLMGQIQAAEAVIPTHLRGLSLLPRGRLDPIDTCELERALFEPGVLDKALAELEAPFDLTLLDTPSGLGMITRGALRASRFVLLPFQASMLSLRSISQALRVVEHVRSAENPDLTLLGILPTMADRTTDSAQEVLVDIWTGFSGVLDTVIPRAEVFARASREGVPIGFLGGRPSPEVRRFDTLAAEVEGLLETLSPREERHADRPQRKLLG
ncbi:MAG: ParA family protein [Byssovorax sp.]